MAPTKQRGAPAARKPASTARRAPAAAAVDAPLVATLMNHRGLVAIDSVTDAFGMSRGQLAQTIGVSREALHKVARVEAPRTQTRLREMLEIVSRVAAWAGGKEQAMAWYRAQPIAAFGGRTAEALVKDGRAAALRDYLDHLAQGGFA